MRSISLRISALNGPTRLGRLRRPPVEEPPNPVRDAAQLEEHPHHHGPAQVAAPDRLPGAVDVSIDDDVRFHDVEAREVAVEEHRFGL